MASLHRVHEVSGWTREVGFAWGGGGQHCELSQEKPALIALGRGLGDLVAKVEKGSSLRRMTTTTSPAAGQGIDASTSPHLPAHASPAPTLDSAREVGRFPPHCWIHVARPPAARLPACLI
jgi:hypothetical protein